MSQVYKSAAPCTAHKPPMPEKLRVCHKNYLWYQNNQILFFNIVEFTHLNFLELLHCLTTKLPFLPCCLTICAKIDLSCFVSQVINKGPSSQVRRGSGIHIVKISSNFYILLVSLRGANPEKFSSISYFVQILWPFEYFRVHLIFLVMWIFSVLGSNYENSQIYNALEDIPLRICPGYYRKQFRT